MLLLMVVVRLLMLVLGRWLVRRARRLPQHHGFEVAIVFGILVAAELALCLRMASLMAVVVRPGRAHLALVLLRTKLGITVEVGASLTRIPLLLKTFTTITPPHFPSFKLYIVCFNIRKVGQAPPTKPSTLSILAEQTQERRKQPIKRSFVEGD